MLVKQPLFNCFVVNMTVNQLIWPILICIRSIDVLVDCVVDMQTARYPECGKLLALLTLAVTSKSNSRQGTLGIVPTLLCKYIEHKSVWLTLTQTLTRMTTLPTSACSLPFCS